MRALKVAFSRVHHQVSFTILHVHKLQYSTAAMITVLLTVKLGLLKLGLFNKLSFARYFHVTVGHSFDNDTAFILCHIINKVCSGFPARWAFAVLVAAFASTLYVGKMFQVDTTLSFRVTSLVLLTIIWPCNLGDTMFSKSVIYCTSGNAGITAFQ